MQRIKVFGLIILSATLFACGGGGGSSDAPAVGKVHESAWITHHDERANQDLPGCQVCHALDFQGHANAVSCSECHFGAPLPPPSRPFVKHPEKRVEGLPWGNPLNHGYWAKFDLFRCQGCHAGPGGPGSNPRFNRPYPGMEQGCESTEGCHGVGNDPFAPFDNGHNPRVAHPSRDPNDPSKQDLLHWYGTRIPYRDDQGQNRDHFLTHIDAGNVERACTPCHGANLESGVGPACLDCHVTSPLENPTGCISCHGVVLEPPADYFRRVGRQKPLSATFLAEVDRGIHRQIVLPDPATPSEPGRFHPLLTAEQQSDCSVCHERGVEEITDPADPRTNVNKHHLVIGQTIPEGSPAPFGAPGDIYLCGSCHLFVLNEQGQFDLQVPRNCQECHATPR